MKTVPLIALTTLGGLLLWSVAPRPVKAADPAPATPPANAPAKPVFTEDFETGQLDNKIWDIRVNGGATVKVQQDKVAHGKNALMVTYPQGARSYAFISTVAKLDESVKSHLFGRVYVYVDAPAYPANHSVFLLAGTPKFPLANFLEIGQVGGKFQLSYQQNATGVTRGETTFRGAAMPPLGKWTCMEWEFNDKPDTITVWLDDKQTDSHPFAFQNVKTELVKVGPDAGFTELSLGFRVWGTTTAPITVYYDDLAISTARIGPIK